MQSFSFLDYEFLANHNCFKLVKTHFKHSFKMHNKISAEFVVEIGSNQISASCGLRFDDVKITRRAKLTAVAF